MSRANEARIYVGNLPNDVRTKDLDDIFYKYGKIKYIDLKNRKGPPFAFVEFEDSRDAEDAIHGRDGYNFNGYKIRVELQKGHRDKGRDRFGSRSGPPTRRSDYRCIVSGLPPTGSWQDLKDHMRDAGNVCYADVFKDGTGVVEFLRYDDMKYAVKHLDDTKFRSHEGESSYIRVKSDYRSKDRSYSRSRSRSRSPRKRSGSRERASPSYSPVRRSRTRSRTVDKDEGDDDARNDSKNRSHSRSRSSSRERGHKRSRHSRSRSRSDSERSPSPSRRRSNDGDENGEGKESQEDEIKKDVAANDDDEHNGVNGHNENSRDDGGHEQEEQAAEED